MSRTGDQFYATSAEVSASVQASLGALTHGHHPTMAGPAGFQYLALMLGLKSIGALAWKPDRLSREVATTVSAQVSIALTRALAIETFTRLEASREGRAVAYRSGGLAQPRVAHAAHFHPRSRHHPGPCRGT